MAQKITTIGGQALMEGIMMVGPQRTVAAFCSEEGQISTEEISVPRLTKLYPILGKPFIRGIFSLIDSFRLGYKALSLSADKLTGEEEEEELSGFDKWLSDHLGEKITGVIMAIASVLGIALAIALFFFLPTVLFNLLEAVALSLIHIFPALAAGAKLCWPFPRQAKAGYFPVLAAPAKIEMFRISKPNSR